jgi:thymidine phosphorylase
VETLRGGGPADLREVTLRLTAWMLVLGGMAPDVKQGEQTARKKLEDGSAWEKFLANVGFQGGDRAVVEDPRKGPHARIRRPVPAEASGFVRRVDAHAVGIASVILGAGRSRKEDAVLPGVGIELLAVQGEPVRAGEPVAFVLGEEEARAEEACRMVAGAYVFSPHRETPASRILEEISE